MVSFRPHLRKQSALWWMLLLSSFSMSAAFTQHGQGQMTRNFVSSTTTNNDKNWLPSSSTARWMVENDGDDGSGAAKVRFTADVLQDAGKNPLDTFLSLLTSDIGSIVLGLIGLLVLTVERLSMQENVPSEYFADTIGEETRTNLIAVIAAGSVLLNGISKLDVTSALAEAVVLDGISQDQVTFTLPPKAAESEIQWALESLLQATPAKTAVLLQSTITSDNNNQWNIMAQAGILPNSDEQFILSTSTPILNRFLPKPNSNKNKGETYLPTLQALPGKTEFTYLPINTQGVLLLAVPTTTDTFVLVLGTNRAKSFTPRDVAWCQSITTRLGTSIC